MIFDFNQLNKENLEVEEDNEGDSEDDNEDNDNDESDGNELENNYYRENEEQNVIHDW